MIEPPAELVAAIRERRAALEERLAAVGRSDARIIAVTKGFGPEAAAAAVAAGFGDLGENYAQELVAKAPLVGPVRWHFLGRLQRNKIRSLAAVGVDLWQSIDRLGLIEELARRAPGARLCVQVDLAGLPDRGGCRFEDVEALVDAATEAGLDPIGLMGVGAPGPPEASRPVFERLVRTAVQLGLPMRSIGMSADLEVALECGATHVRVGRALMGDRPQRR